MTINLGFNPANNFTGQFNPQAYLNNNPDVLNWALTQGARDFPGSTPEQLAAHHFSVHGLFEGRYRPTYAQPTDPNAPANVFDMAGKGLEKAFSSLDAAVAQPTRQLADTDLTPYLNPYREQVIDTTMAEHERNRQMAMNNTDAAASGAFGGSRHGVMQAETNRGFADIGAQTLANLNSQGFLNAQDKALRDISNELAGRAMTISGASALGSLSNLGFGMGQQAVQGQMQSGQMQQDMYQRLIDAARAQYGGFTDEQNEALSRYLATIDAIPVPLSEQETENPGLLGILSNFL